MSGFKLSVFSGIRPKVGARLLHESEAQVADNCKLFSGELRSWRRPKEVATPSKAASGTVRSIFRVNYLNTDYWLNWSKDVDCERGPVAGDDLQRIYFTGDGEPRMSHASLATQGGGDPPVAAHVLGVFPPQTGPTVVPSGGTGAAETRSYVYTFVTALGEESQPSPPTTVAGKIDDSWALSNIETAALNTFTVTGGSWGAGIATLNVASTRGLRVGEEVNISGVNPAGYNGNKLVLTEVNAGNVKYAVAVNPGAWSSGGTIARVGTHNTTLMVKRIYRVLTGSAGAEFQFVAEIAVATTTYNDTKAASALGEILPSEDWEMPPVNMIGMGSAANGVMFGFSKNELCLSESFRPHAWPSKYRVAFTRDIVAVESYSSGIVVATKGKPGVVIGSTPGTMQPDDIEVIEPCLSKRGTAGMAFGVIYPSPNGWVLSGVGGTAVASQDVVTKTEFETFFPATMLAVAYQGRYFAWYTNGSGVVRGLVFDKSGQGAVLTPLQQAADAAWTDPETGELYIVHDGKIKKWDGDTFNNLPFEWRSKVITLPDLVNLGAARVRAKYDDLADSAAEDAQEALDAAYNADILNNPEVWPGQSNTRGDFGGNMLGEFMLGGSLLRDSSFATFDNRSLQFQLYAADDEGDMVLRHTKNLTNDRAFKLPDGYMSADFEVQLLGNIDARGFEVAETMRELKKL